MFALLAAAAAASATLTTTPFPGDWRGTLCVAAKLSASASPTCSAFPGNPDLPAGSTHIDFYWTSRSGDALRIGAADHGQQPSLANTGIGRIVWRLSSDSRGNRLSAVTLEMKRDKSDWNVRLPLSRLVTIRSVYVPPGTYDLDIHGGHFKRLFRRAITIQDGKTVDLGTLTLTPLPEISGTVISDADHAPVAAAAILVGESPAALTDAQGHFAFVPRDDVPFAITATHEGFADNTVVLAPGRHGFRLEPIVMTRGATVTLRVHRSCADPCQTSLSLRRLDTADPRPQQWKSVAEQKAYGPDPKFTFTRVPAGDYAAVVGGAQPLQRQIVRFPVADTAIEQEITLHDGRLKGVVSRGKSLFPDAALSFSGEGGLWTSVVSADHDGQYDLAFWRQDLLFVAVGTGPRPFRASRAFSDADEQIWDISVPVNSIRGRIVDGTTGAPIGGATISDALVSGAGRHGPFPLTVGADGVFSLEMLPAGTHRLQARANGYLDSAPIDVELNATAAEQTIDIPLNAGASIDYAFVDEDGNAVPNALVFDSFGTDGFSTTRVLFTNGLGHLEYHIARGQRRGLYALTEDGSFVVAVADAANPTPPPVTMLAPSAAIDLFATRDKHPAAGMSFLVRFNGYFLPPGFFEQITTWSRTTNETDATGHLFLPHVPPGVYEFWPFRNYDEYRGLLRTVNATAPHARIDAVPGDNAVTVPVEQR